MSFFPREKIEIACCAKGIWSRFKILKERNIIGLKEF